MFISLATEDPVQYVSIVLAVVISVVLHELGHGVAAIRQGDDTPRITGHMTLNPQVHMGWMGLFFLFFFGITYGAMPVNPSRFRSRYGRALVAFAGPAVNLVLAAIAILVMGLWLRLAGAPGPGLPENIFGFCFWLGVLNLILFTFNLLPIPPLDGSSILGDLVPAYRKFAANGNNQPIFLGAFILVFMTAGRYLFPKAIAAVDTAITWIA